MDNWTNKDLRIKIVFQAQCCHFPTKGDGHTLVRCGLASRPHPITQECIGVLGWRLVWVFICMSWVFLAKMLLVGVSILELITLMSGVAGLVATTISRVVVLIQARFGVPLHGKSFNLILLARPPSINGIYHRSRDDSFIELRTN